MARRSRKNNHTPLILASALGIGALAFGGLLFLRGGSDPASTLKALDVQQYIDSNSSLRGNKYRMVGRVDDRLDKNWPTTQGRIFSVSVTEGRNRELVPVHVPGSLNEITIDRGVEYVFVVKVANNGILEAEVVSPS